MNKRLESMIHEGANKPVNGKYNLTQFKAQKAQLLTQKGVYQSIVDCHVANPDIPLYAIITVGISNQACKVRVASDGYKKFNAEKANVCIKMARHYARKIGNGTKPSDVVWRFVSRYYDKKSRNLIQFMADVKNATIYEGKRGEYKAMCQSVGI